MISLKIKRKFKQIKYKKNLTIQLMPSVKYVQKLKKHPYKRWKNQKIIGFIIFHHPLPSRENLNSNWFGKWERKFKKSQNKTKKKIKKKLQIREDLQYNTPISLSHHLKYFEIFALKTL